MRAYGQPDKKHNVTHKFCEICHPHMYRPVIKKIRERRKGTQEIQEQLQDLRE